MKRRALLQSLPLLAANRILGANDRVRVGVIGVGGRSNLLIDQLPEAAEIIAVADVFPQRAYDAAAKREAKWKIFDDHRRLLEMKELDGVIVGTCDHQRVWCSIHACQAGKDVYAEKPLTLYVSEGRTLVKAARKYNRVFQVGSQQRSMAMNRVACDFVRNGGLGKLLFVEAVNYPGPKRIPADLGEQPLPNGLNWNLWLNQTPELPYHKSLQTGWMQWWNYSGGEMTNWGAHGLDQVQWAVGGDGSGPTEFWPLEDGPKGALACRYSNGVVVRLVMPMGDLAGGAIFVGEKGRIEITRNSFRSDPQNLIKDVPPKEEVDKWNRAQWQAKYHMQDWLEAMRTRRQPLADVEIGHRSISLCHLFGITRQLNRKLHWDPATERFQGDEEANALLTRPRRKGFEIDNY